MTKAQTDALLEEIRQRFDRAADHWKEIQAEATTDMRYVSGDPWDPQDRKAREDANRPCLSLDELGQYFNQVVNDVRANPRAVKFSPVGNGANDQTAEFYGDKTREIEYRSKAQMAYTTAFQNAVERSYGWVRLKTEYQPQSFDQDLWIEPIYNPDLVLSDPDAVKPDSSDMKYLFFYEQWPITEFRRTYPDADVASFPDFLGKPSMKRWLTEDKITLAEYWRIVQEKKTLLLLRDPKTGQTTTAYKDQLDKMPPGAIVLKEREEDVPRVEQYLTNGIEILAGPTPWAGKYIPFASCFGKVIYVDEGSGAERRILSMTRLARDPYMLYCYYRTAEAEQVGMSTKFPYFWYEGQLSAISQQDLQKSLHEPIAGIKVKPTVEGVPPGTVLPHPQRNPFEPAIQALEVGAEGARRAIQAAMGSNFLPTQAQRKNEKSGVALKEIEQSAQKGTYHFIDHYDDMIAHVGVMIEDLLDKVIDTPRNVGIRKKNDDAEQVRVNDPSAQGEHDLPTIKGDHLVTISTGPAYESQREMADDFADTLISTPLVAQVAGPEAAAKILALAVRLKNLGALGDEIADAIYPKPGPNGEPSAGQLQKENAQMKQMLEQAATAIQQLEQEKQAKIIEGETKLRQTSMQEHGENQREIARLEAQIQQKFRDLEVKLEIEMAKLGSAQSMARAEIEQQDLHLHSQQQLQREQMQQADAQATLDRAAAQDAAAMKASQQNQQPEASA